MGKSIMISEPTRIILNRAKGKILTDVPALEKATYDTIINILAHYYIDGELKQWKQIKKAKR